MIKYTDKIINCPFDKNHQLKEIRLQWHLLKCKAFELRKQQRLPIVHCPYRIDQAFIRIDCEFVLEPEVQLITDFEWKIQCNSIVMNREDGEYIWEDINDDDVIEIGIKEIIRVPDNSPERIEID